MADKEPRSTYKKPKAEPTLLDSPIKAKADLNSTMDMILKKLAEVHDLARSTKANTDSMQLELTAIRANMDTINTRLSDAEQRISDAEDLSTETKKDIRSLHDTTSALKKQMSELEDRNRRGNVRIIGIPEGAEDNAGSCTAFLETWIPSITGIKFNHRLEM